MSRIVSNESIEAIAKETGFKTKNFYYIPSGFSGYCIFLSAYNSPSLSEYSIDLAHNNNCLVSKQAIDKRFNERTRDMLISILQKVMSKQFKGDFKLKKDANFFSEIRIMDSTEFLVSKKVAESFPGYGGKGR